MRQQGPPHMMSIQDQFTKRVNGFADGDSGTDSASVTIAKLVAAERFNQDKPQSIYLTDIIAGGGTAAATVTITGPPEGPFVVDLPIGEILEHSFTTPIATERGEDLVVAVAGSGEVSVLISGFHG